MFNYILITGLVVQLAAVKGPSHSFYFAGDTGYCNAFEQIGRTYGPFSLAALPIGTYEPRPLFKLYSS